MSEEEDSVRNAGKRTTDSALRERFRKHFEITEADRRRLTPEQIADLEASIEEFLNSPGTEYARPERYNVSDLLEVRPTRKQHAVSEQSRDKDKGSKA